MDYSRLLPVYDEPPWSGKGCIRRLWLFLSRRHRTVGLFLILMLFVSQLLIRYEADVQIKLAWTGLRSKLRVDDSSPTILYNDAFLINTSGCRIPYMDPINDQVKDFVYDYKDILCRDPPPLVESNDTAVFVVRENIPDYHTTASDLKCCYRAMWRYAPNITIPEWDPERGFINGTGPLNDGIKYGNDIRYDQTCVDFTLSATVPHEFIRVECTSRGKEVYRDIHAFFPRKRPRGFQGTNTAPDENSLNVVILGVDSVSRLNFLRKMPRTAKFLNNTLHAVDLLGYNKVEDNTFPNLVPLLSGFNIPELSKSCWPNEGHFDACPWIWKTFNKNGYVNTFVEDTAWMGLFHYLKKGFIHQPTDYDPRPLLYVGEKELGRKKGLNANFCIGQRLQIEVLIDYAVKFIRTMKQYKQKVFGLFWGTSLSHDYLNEVGEADVLYENFLKELYQMGVLNNTVLLFMSDHGLRYGKILSTYQGHLEERLPPMYIVLPPWFEKRYPVATRNLRTNRRRLMTVFDLHETLPSFMNLRTLEDTPLERATSEIQERYKTGNSPRGISVFTPIPEHRTCTEAGIPTHYCACQYLSKLATDDPMALKVANFVVESINKLLQNHTVCAQLSVSDVHDAWRGEPVAHVNNTTPKFHEHEYQVKIHTKPGSAMLSSTVRYNLDAGEMRLAGSVSRLNSYGKQSWCVSDFKLRLYCYCIHETPTHQ